jgi:type II secretory ATPase GspE/PulE/Tfp pilus assembly ATPase PilB-like protein
MVGEIRDAETANIALQAAQTGHLVLSTLHTNDAPSAITRLLNLGCDPFIVSNSLAGVLAQRLVRRICSNCSQTADLSVCEEHLEIIKAYDLNPNQLRSGRGCEKCLYTGYYGRIGIYSYFRMSKELAELIHKNASIKQIVEQAKKSGFVELYESALAHLISGNTSLSEVLPFLISEHAEREQSTEANAIKVDQCKAE